MKRGRVEAMLKLNQKKFPGNRRLRGRPKSRGNKKKKKSLGSTSPGLEKNSHRSRRRKTGETLRSSNPKKKTGSNRRRPASGEWTGEGGARGGGRGGLLSRIGKAADSFEARERGPLSRVFRVVMPLLVLGGLGFGGYYAYKFVTSSPHFQVSKVTVSPTQQVSEKKLIELSRLEERPNIFSLDLKEVARRIEAHPWVEKAKVSRRLPSSIHMDVVEQEPGAVVLLERLYLVNTAGKVFKRATKEEAMEHTLITGVSREEYKGDPKRAERRFRRALKILMKYRRKRRPPVGEIHLSQNRGVVLYTREKGVEIRLGKGSVDAKLLRLDSVLTSLGRRSGRVRVIRLDNRVRPQRITVRLAEVES